MPVDLRAHRARIGKFVSHHGIMHTYQCNSDKSPRPWGYPGVTAGFVVLAVLSTIVAVGIWVAPTQGPSASTAPVAHCQLPGRKPLTDSMSVPFVWPLLGNKGAEWHAIDGNVSNSGSRKKPPTYKSPIQLVDNLRSQTNMGSSVMVVNCGLTGDHSHVGPVGSARPGKLYFILLCVLPSSVFRFVLRSVVYRCVFGDSNSHPLWCDFRHDL